MTEQELEKLLDRTRVKKSKEMKLKFTKVLSDYIGYNIVKGHHNKKGYDISFENDNFKLNLKFDENKQFKSISLLEHPDGVDRDSLYDLDLVHEFTAKDFFDKISEEKEIK